LSFTTLAALHIEIPQSGEWVIVQQRTVNDLPAEVLGAACWVSLQIDQESGYVIDDPRNNEQVPLEFINNQWY